MRPESAGLDRDAQLRVRHAGARLRREQHPRRPLATRAGRRGRCALARPAAICRCDGPVVRRHGGGKDRGPTGGALRAASIQSAACTGDRDHERPHRSHGGAVDGPDRGESRAPLRNHAPADGCVLGAQPPARRRRAGRRMARPRQRRSRGGLRKEGRRASARRWRAARFIGGEPRKTEAVLRSQVRQRDAGQQLADHRRRGMADSRVGRSGPAARPRAARAHRRFRVGGTRSRTNGPRPGARRNADSQAQRPRVERSGLLGNQRGVRRTGARLPRGVEGREVLQGRTGAGWGDGRARRCAAQRGWRGDRARPPGRCVRRAHRAASAQDTETQEREARHGFDLHRRRARWRDARRGRLGETMDRVDAKTIAKHWRWEKDPQGLVWLTFDKQGESANTFSREALQELAASLDAIAVASPKGLVIRSTKDGFIAGADVEEFTRFKSPEEAMSFVKLGWDVFQRLHDLPFPTTAMINGFCMGGGLELALACRYRVALDDPKTRIAFPEVMLGIMPAWHGVQWLPKLVGPAAGLDMLLTGRALDARRAKRIGLVDEAGPLRILENTARIVTLEARPRRKLALLQRLMLGLRPLVVSNARKQVAKRAPREHYPAPYAVLEMWQKYDGDQFAAANDPTCSITALFDHPTTQNLIRIFFLQERLKGQGKGSDFQARHVHVVGAGVMGGDIAAVCAIRGITVTLQDTSPERLAPAMQRAASL